VRRTTAAVVGTFAGTVLLLGARLGAAPAVDGDADPSAIAADGTEQLPDPTEPARAAPRTSTGRPSPSRAPKPAGTKTKSSTPAPADRGGTGPSDGTFRGGASTNQFGTIQVTITVSAGRMTGISATYPTTPSRTGQINSRAIPTLKREALAAQNATIDTVSGATYTSASYQVSLRSALTAARR
jgi:uncharacterized protein with FMN-binding domain